MGEIDPEMIEDMIVTEKDLDHDHTKEGESMRVVDMEEEEEAREEAETIVEGDIGEVGHEQLFLSVTNN